MPSQTPHTTLLPPRLINNHFYPDVTRWDREYCWLSDNRIAKLNMEPATPSSLPPNGPQATGLFVPPHLRGRASNSAKLPELPEAQPDLIASTELPRKCYCNGKPFEIANIANRTHCQRRCAVPDTCRLGKGPIDPCDPQDQTQTLRWPSQTELRRQAWQPRPCYEGQSPAGLRHGY